MFNFERLRTSLSTPSAKKFLATALVAIFVIVSLTSSTFVSDVHAQATSTQPDTNAGACGDGVVGLLCTGVSFMLGLIADFIGRMILLVVSVLIAFAQYNGFSNAAPVVQGWIVVRDTTNMFFIIVLLLSAFATVINMGAFKEYYYEKVLPALLLQVVLINFSKTIIQLGIDFSQVVMLTFVNAFAQSAAGNFVYALGLDKMMQIGENSGSVVGFANIIIAYMLAIFFMAIALGVVIILTAYLVYRIVGLWIILIISPLAFFVTALPGKLKDALGAIGSQYWTKLTALLTGGPVIAFFLWLTLAITQQSTDAANSQGGLSTVLNIVRPDSGAGNVADGSTTAAIGGALGGAADGAVNASFGFISAIADSAHIASFIIGIALMLTALDAAVSSSKAISDSLSNFADKVRTKAKSYGKWETYYNRDKEGNLRGALGRTRAGITFAGKTAYNLADDKFDLSRKVGGKTAAILAKTPALLQRTDTYQKAILGTNAFAARLDKRNKEKLAADEAISKSFTQRARSGDELAQLTAIGNQARTTREGLIGETFSSSQGGAAASSRLAVEKLNDRLYKERKHTYKEGLKAKYISEGMDETTAETTAKAASEQLVKRDLFAERARNIEAQRSDAIKRGDKTKIEEFEKTLRSSPLLSVEGKAREDALKDLVTSPDAYKEVDAYHANNGEVLTEFMVRNGWKDDGQGGLVLQDYAAWKRKKEEVSRVNKTLHEGLEAQERFVENSPGVTTTQLRGMQFRKDPTDQSMQAYSLVDNNEVAPSMARGQRIRNTRQIETLDALKTTEGKTTTNVMNAVNLGASIPEMIKAGGTNELLADAVFEKVDLAGQTLEPVYNNARNLETELAGIRANYEPAIANLKQQRSEAIRQKGVLQNEEKSATGTRKTEIKSQLAALEAQKQTATAEIDKLNTSIKTEQTTSKANAKVRADQASALVSKAIAEMGPAIRALQQINTATDGNLQTKVLAKFADANIEAIFSQYGGMPQSYQNALETSLSTMIGQSDQFRKKATQTAEEKKIIATVDRLRTKIAKEGLKTPVGLRRVMNKANDAPDNFVSA